MRKILTWVIGIFLFLAVLGIGYYVYRNFFGATEESGPEIVTLVCNKECANRGQCGTAQGDDEKPVVLGGKDGPIVAPKQHDVFFPSGSSAEVKSSMEATVVEGENGEPFQHTFSRVEWVNPMGDIAETGWVAEWCIERDE